MGCHGSRRGSTQPLGELLVAVPAVVPVPGSGPPRMDAKCYRSIGRSSNCGGLCNDAKLCSVAP